MLQLASPTTPSPSNSISSPTSSGGGGVLLPTASSAASGSMATSSHRQAIVGGGSGSHVTSSDACLSIVHSLMQHRLDGESESFSKRAIESLVKKLKDKREELDALIQAVTSAGATPTCCITIPRTLDGRLQVAGRKGFPHVVYAKIWRWPDLHKNELKHLRLCQYAFDLKQNAVCVNPYHYERVIGAAMDVTDSPPSSAAVTPSLAPMPLSLTNQNPLLSSGPASAMHSPLPLPLPLAQRQMPQRHPQLSQPQQQQQQQQHRIHPQQNFHNPVASSSNSSAWLDSAIHQPQHHGYNHIQPTVTWTGTAAVSGAVSGISRPGVVSNSATASAPSTGSVPSSANNPDYWCSISYYEQDEQIGETFKVPYRQSSVTIDGYTDPSSPHRFCLGQLSNVRRTDVSERARLHIGRGVDLSMREPGDVWLECQSTHPVFMESIFLDREAGRPPGDVVHKIYAGARIKVFDIGQCHQEMKLQAARAAAATAAAAAADDAGASTSNNGHHRVGSDPLHASDTGIGVDDLRRLCSLRMSFVKGWGLDYNRKSITQTPCWVEIQLHKPLQLLDEVLYSSQAT